MINPGNYAGVFSYTWILGIDPMQVFYKKLADQYVLPLKLMLAYSRFLNHRYWVL